MIYYVLYSGTLEKSFKIFLIIVNSVIFSFSLKAEHIVSGTMYYEYLGPGTVPNTNMYEITMRLFTDCNIDKRIEPNLEIGIYKGTPGNYTFVTKRTAFLGGSPRTTQELGNCALLLSNICVGLATYTFREELPISSSNYLIAYQRCCRNMTITNILDPGRTGSTIYMEITPESQKLKNSSPKFDNVPPLVACVNEPLHMDLKGIDTENDSFTYELCAPLTGGGPRGSGGTSGDPNDCLGITPNPQLCIPTLKEVTFANANFTPSKPFPSTSPVLINNGILTAAPTTIGQYIFGVCVKEYRNGMLLSIQRRDIQLNFAICNIVIKASVKNATVQNNTANFTFCDPGNKFKIINESSDTLYIKNTNWEFIGPKGNVLRSDSFHFNEVLSDTGIYTGKLILNKGNRCADSLSLRIKVGAKVTSSISTISPIDTCSLGPFTFTPGTALPSTAEWDFGDGTKSGQLNNVIHSYTKPGSYIIKLKVSNEPQCSTEITKTIRLFPVPQNVSLKNVDSLLCYPSNIVLGINELADSTYTYQWTLSNGKSYLGVNPSVPVIASGNFKIKLTILSPTGCQLTRDFAQTFKAYDKPKALFTTNGTKFDLKSADLILTNKSTNATNYYWSLGDQSVSSDKDVKHTYVKPGNYIITLKVSNQNGCTDSATTSIKVGEIQDIFVPNIFTPNGDGVNDIFRPEITRSDILQFELIVLNRWGDIVFSSQDPTLSWNGSNSLGRPAPSGVYVYQIKISLPEEATKIVKGSVTLIR